jgi:hypothetical protein
MFFRSWILVFGAVACAASPAFAVRVLRPGDLLGIELESSVRLLDEPLGSDAIVSGAPLVLGDRYCIEAAIDHESGSSVVVYEWSREALVRIDLATGAWMVLSSPQDGAGPLLRVGIDEDKPDIAVEPSGSILVARPDFWGTDAIVRVDPVTGDRTLLAESAESQSDPGFFAVSHLAVAPDGTVLVSGAYHVEEPEEHWVDAIYEFAPLLGTFSRRGMDLAFTSSGDVAVGADGRLFATGEYLPSTDPSNPIPLYVPLVEIAEDGAISLVSGEDLGTGPSMLLAPQSLDVTTDGAVVASHLGAALFRFDPVTGDRTVFYGDPAIGSSPTLRLPGLTAAPDGSVIAAACPDDTLLRIDPVSGESAVAFDPQVGSGPQAREWQLVGVDASRRVVVAAVDDLLHVDPATGDRTTWSAGEGTDDTFPTRVVSLAMTAKGDAFVSRHQDHGFCAPDVLRVDAASGARSVLSGSGVGAGPAFGCPSHLALGADGTLFVSDGGEDALLRVDPASGDRALVSDASRGEGPIWFGIGPIAVRPSGDLFAIDDYFDHIYRVDPATGDRAEILVGRTGWTTELSDLRSVTATPNGDLVVTARDGGGPEVIGIFRIDPDADTYERISSENVHQVVAVPALVPEPETSATTAAAVAVVAALAAGRAGARPCPAVPHT